MKSIRYILCLFFFVTAVTYAYSQSWDLFFDKGKELYEQGNYEKAIKNLELYLKYETTNPKAEAKQLLERAKKELAEEQTKQVAKTETTLPTEETPVIVAEQPSNTEQPHEEYFIETALGLNMKMIYVEGGTFMMGNESIGAPNSERPLHKVTLDSFYIAEFEVTQGDWRKIAGNPKTKIQRTVKLLNKLLVSGLNEKIAIGDDYPMYFIDYDEAMEFCKRLSEKSGRKYRLPTEAEWEFAARGGNNSKGYIYSGSNNVDEVAWYKDNRGTTQYHLVGQKRANELGLHDMSGNVSEWCLDHYDENFYKRSPENNPINYGIMEKVIRGGHSLGYSNQSRVTFRDYSFSMNSSSDIGFRVVCIPD